jgi:hypothetical protein
MPHWILYNQTIEKLLDSLPANEEALYEVLQERGEKHLKDLAPFLDQILSILQRYKA